MRARGQTQTRHQGLFERPSLLILPWANKVGCRLPRHSGEDRSLRPRSKVTHPLYRKRSAEIAIASEARKAVAIGYHGFGHCLRPPAPGRMYGMAHQRGNEEGIMDYSKFHEGFLSLVRVLACIETGGARMKIFHRRYHAFVHSHLHTPSRSSGD